MAWLKDLSPFFEDRCWQFVLLARSAPVGVILRRGPSAWWHMTRWDIAADQFIAGQWFRGRLYPRKCDLSPDGRLLSYFGGKMGAGKGDASYGWTWIAVSRPPYFTALALWPMGDTWGGQTIFFDDGSLYLGGAGKHHPNHPPGPLQIAPARRWTREEWLRISPPWARTGWVPTPAGWGKSNGERNIERLVGIGEDLFPSRKRSMYALTEGGQERGVFEAHWADFDQSGRLVASVGGRIFEGQLTRTHGLRWRVLGDFQDKKPIRMEAPDWAKHW